MAGFSSCCPHCFRRAGLSEVHAEGTSNSGALPADTGTFQRAFYLIRTGLSVRYVRRLTSGCTEFAVRKSSGSGRRTGSRGGGKIPTSSLTNFSTRMRFSGKAASYITASAPIWMPVGAAVAPSSRCVLWMGNSAPPSKSNCPAGFSSR